MTTKQELYAEFYRLYASNPEKVREVLAQYPDLAKAAFGEMEAENLRTIARESDGYKNFLAYYKLIHGNEILPHNLDPVKKCFQAHEEGKIFEWLGFRGCRKTTTIDITLATFLHGHHPEKSGVITGANDPNSKLIAKSISQIIEYHPEFKAVFPYVTIDKDKGWGAEGYWIRQTHEVVDGELKEITREAWTARQAKKNDPSFVGGGYKSSEINGKHPDLYLIVDDLHDIDSSASVTEREAIKTTFTMQILPTVPTENGKLAAWVIVTGVPFAKDDTYQLLRQSGGCIFVSLPVMRRVPDGEGTYIDGINKETGVTYEDIRGWWILTWPENFSPDVIITWRAKGKSMFWQMFMIDIAVAKTAGLTYYSYDGDIPLDLPMAGGADPTNVQPDREVGGKKRSSFALCHLGKLPSGGAVVVDGFLKPCGIVEAKDAILQAQTKYRNWKTTGVENVGGGAVFLQYLHTVAGVKAVASNLANPKQKRIASKIERFDKEVAPWLDNMVLRISSKNTPYLVALRNLCDNFFDLPDQCEERDAGDALYHAIKMFPEVFRIPVSETPQEQRERRQRGVNPLAGIGSWTGYGRLNG